MSKEKQEIDERMTLDWGLFIKPIDNILVHEGDCRGLAYNFSSVADWLWTRYDARTADRLCIAYHVYGAPKYGYHGEAVFLFSRPGADYVSWGRTCLIDADGNETDGMPLCSGPLNIYRTEEGLFGGHLPIKKNGLAIVRNELTCLRLAADIDNITFMAVSPVQEITASMLSWFRGKQVSLLYTPEDKEEWERMGKAYNINTYPLS